MELFYFVLPAPNVEKSKAFFTKVFGWKGYGGGQGGHVDCTNTPCGLGGDVNEVYFTTLDLPKTLEKVLAHGGTIVTRCPSSTLLPFLRKRGTLIIKGLPLNPKPYKP